MIGGFNGRFYKTGCGFAPCGGCKDRAAGCHGECKRYLEWAAKRKKELEECKRNILR